MPLRATITAITLSLTLLITAAANQAAADEAFARGLKEARAGRIQNAIARWSETIRRNPDSYAAYVNRGVAYMGTGYVLNAVSDWHEARRLSPVFALGVYTPGFIDQLPGDTRILNFVKSLEIDPDHVGSVIMMGAAYLDVQRPEMAAELYRKAIDLTRNPMLKNTLDHWARSLELSDGR